jgi:hypothetical protein
MIEELKGEDGEGGLINYISLVTRWNYFTGHDPFQN